MQFQLQLNLSMELSLNPLLWLVYNLRPLAIVLLTNNVEV